MNKALTLIILVVLAVALAWYFSMRQDQAEMEQVEVLPPPAMEREPAPIQHPVEEIQIEDQAEPTIEEPAAEPEPEPEPLPSLEESDPEMLGLMAETLGLDVMEQFFVLEFVISRFVATVDSLPSAKVAPMMMPIKPVEGKFLVLGEGDEAAISPENAARYQSLVDLVLGLDTEQMVALYVRYYPLFQEAFEAQGFPDAYFNDRLVEVIDHLLETPDVRGIVELRQNEAVYEFANEDLENLSAGQKAIIRLGPENSLLMKEKLREIRAAVAGASAP